MSIHSILRHRIEFQTFFFIFLQWNLVCDHDFYPTLGLVLLAVGGIIGNYIFGYLQDTMGRKPSFFIYLLVQCVFGVATAFAQNYIIWTIYRIGVGFTVPAIMTTPYVLGKFSLFFLFLLRP